MKIYFAGSIRGGREDKALYLEIIKELGKYGQVLTEHIGDQSTTEIGESKLTDSEIYNRDMSWLTQADIVIAEVTQPSLGVGYELGIISNTDKPIVCLYRKQENKRLSAMIAGCDRFKIVEYKDFDELVEIFRNMFFIFSDLKA